MLEKRTEPQELKQAGMPTYDMEIRYTMKCSQCGKEHVCNFKANFGLISTEKQRVPLPGWPPRWRVFHGVLLCEDHKISIVIDGTERDLV